MLQALAHVVVLFLLFSICFLPSIVSFIRRARSFYWTLLANAGILIGVGGNFDIKVTGLCLIVLTLATAGAE
tara:strand:- start:743 stop:958 length:216 start_codon:yes stop_codon:yes gene_type:complete